MSYRIDRPFIRYLHSTDLSKVADAYMKLPFVYVSQDNLRDVTEFYEREDVELNARNVFDQEWMPWDEFAIYFPIGQSNETNERMETVFVFSRMGDEDHIEYNVFSMIRYVESNDILHCIWQVRPGENDTTETLLIDGPPEWTQEHINNAGEVCMWQVQACRFFFAWLYFGDHYWIEKKSSRKHPNILPESELKKKPWQRRDLTTMIALNRMPGEPSPESVVLGHSSKKPHMKRGHWRKLDNPRFRNHPKFGDRIWVKPCWVGPKQKEYEGHVYRVFEPNPQENFDDVQDDQPQSDTAVSS